MARHLTLNDSAYKAARNKTTGTPYKDLIADLIKGGVQIELCGGDREGTRVGQRQPASSIRVNTDAMARTIELVQRGFVKIME